MGFDRALLFAFSMPFQFMQRRFRLAIRKSAEDSREYHSDGHTVMVNNAFDGLACAWITFILKLPSQ
jgi:hypothetical protein